MPFKNNCSFINRMLLTDEIDEIRQQDPFLVHSAIYPIVQKHLTRLGVNDLHHLGSYELKVGTYTFDMEILVLGEQSAPSCFSVFLDILRISQFTHFWENRITLFREVNRYYELKEFIAINNLKKHVISVEEISGVNSSRQPIKLVTFDSTSDEIQRYQLLENYKEFLRTKSFSATYPRTYHYYFTRSFPWHLTDMSRMYRSPFQNQRIFLELQTFLTCLRELTYEREPHLDLISLCSLKLAFCDELNLTEASQDLQFEIDALIERFLRRMVKKQTYIKNGEFDLSRYVAETNSVVSSSYPAIHNLIYTFQDLFHCTNLVGDTRLQFIEMSQTLMLIDENKHLMILRDRSNIPYKVDCTNYNKMNSKLFCELLEFHNVREIRLSTNSQWINEPYLNDLSEYGAVHGMLMIILEGKNEFNFIENFIQFLKTIPICITCEMELLIKVTLKSYNIFKKLETRGLEFHGLKITFTMLTELLECDLKNISVSFYNCTIEDKTSTWSLLINGFDRKNVRVHIFQSENTWQYLFESITKHLTEFKLNEFNFKCHLLLIFNKYFEGVWVDQMKFRFDEFNTRLELQNESGQAIDLYDWKNPVDEPEDDYKNLEFYQ